MDIINKKYYSNNSFYTQLLKLKAFRGDQTKFVNLPYYQKIDGHNTLFISKQIWSRFEKDDNTPNVWDLILITGYFKVRVEYFFIKDAQPQDYAADETSADNKFMVYNEEAKQEYSLDCFHIQLKKLRLFSGFKKQVAAARHFKINRLTWLILERGDRRPDLHKLVIFSNCFRVRIEYFLIADAKPGEYIIKDDQVNRIMTQLDKESGKNEIYTIRNLPGQLKKIRLFHGYLTQSALYTLFVFEKQFWYLWEIGKSKPNLVNLFLLTRYLSERIEYFFIADAKPEDYINNESMLSAINMLDDVKQKYSADDFYIQLNRLRKLYKSITIADILRELEITIRVLLSWIKNKRFPGFCKIAALANLYKVRVQYFFIKDAKPEEYSYDPNWKRRTKH